MRYLGLVKQLKLQEVNVICKPSAAHTPGFPTCYRSRDSRPEIWLTSTCFLGSHFWAAIICHGRDLRADETSPQSGARIFQTAWSVLLQPPPSKATNFVLRSILVRMQILHPSWIVALLARACDPIPDFLSAWGVLAAIIPLTWH